jgi:hypothetical protein
MKRIVSLLLVLVLCLGLCACGHSEEDAKKAIVQNSWIGSFGSEGQKTEFAVTFLNNNEAWIKVNYPTGFEYTWEGSYEVTDNQIVVSDTRNKVDIFVDYTFNGNKISLTLHDPISKNTVLLSEGPKGL